MNEAVEITMRVTAFVRKAGRSWSAVAPRFAVASQGTSAVDAKRCLKEALELWVESCLERGTLDQALREVGFRPATWGSTKDEDDRVRVRVRKARSDDGQESIMGSRTEVSISVPAYQAAAFQALSGNRASL